MLSPSTINPNPYDGQEYYKPADPPELPPSYSLHPLPTSPPYPHSYDQGVLSPPPPPLEPLPPISSYSSTHVVPVAHDPNVTEGFSFKDTNIRKGFIRKVYAILFLQLLTTVGIVSVFTFVEPLRDFIRDRIYFIFIAGVVVLLVYPFVAYSRYGKRLQRKYPENIAVVIILTVVMAIFTGTIASFFQTEAVIFGFAITAGVCLAVSVLSFISRFSIESWGGFFMILFLCGIWFAIFTPFTYQRTWYVQVVYGLIGAIVFAVFLAYDTSRLLDKDDNDLKQEDYIIASIRIYTDVIVIFIFILLACFGGGGQ